MAVWVGALGFPALVFVTGALLRLYRRAPQTCATDVFGLFVVFDAIVASDPDPFLRFINSSAGSHDLFWAVFLLGFIATVVWVFCMLEGRARPYGLPNQSETVSFSPLTSDFNSKLKMAAHGAP
jgi:hypothetical protein